MPFLTDMYRSKELSMYLSLGLVYFLINGLFLPQGLFYTTILTPVFAIWLYYQKQIKPLFIFILVLTPYAIIHIINGVNVFYYIRSCLLLFSCAVFFVSASVLLKKKGEIEQIYHCTTQLNLVLTVFALVFLYTNLDTNLWATYLIPEKKLTLDRLKMFTSEPSVYALQLTPIYIYMYLRFLLSRLKNPLLYAPIVTIPILLSMSLGVFAALFLSLLILSFLLFKRRLIARKVQLYFLFLAMLTFIGTVFYIKSNPGVFTVTRVTNIINHQDQSVKDRICNSYLLSWEIAKKKSIVWGCGLGQVKILGKEVFENFYKKEYTVKTIAIPNVTGETLAIFGISGLLLRFLLLLFLFFKTQVYQNYYRLAVYIFIFVYQFTGSNIMNAAEYFLWAIAFTKCFSDFDTDSPTRKN